MRRHLFSAESPQLHKPVKQDDTRKMFTAVLTCIDRATVAVNYMLVGDIVLVAKLIADLQVNLDISEGLK